MPYLSLDLIDITRHVGKKNTIICVGNYFDL